MTTHSDDRATDDDHRLSVTSDDGGEQTAYREPVDEDGQPIFPPGPPDAGIPEAEMSAHSVRDTRDDDAQLSGDPAGNAARLLPDGTGYNSPADVDRDDSLADEPGYPDGTAVSPAGAPAAGAPAAGATAVSELNDDRDGEGDRDRDRDNPEFSSPGDVTDADDTSRADVQDRTEGSDDRLDDRTADGTGPSEPAHLVDEYDQAWLALQGTFVDDPAQAVREAGDRVEQQLRDFRSHLDSADTEQLRTAFKRFRDLSNSLR